MVHEPRSDRTERRVRRRRAADGPRRCRAVHRGPRRAEAVDARPLPPMSVHRRRIRPTAAVQTASQHRHVRRQRPLSSRRRRGRQLLFETESRCRCRVRQLLRRRRARRDGRHGPGRDAFAFAHERAGQAELALLVLAQVEADRVLGTERDARDDRRHEQAEDRTWYCVSSARPIAYERRGLCCGGRRMESGR